MSVMHSGFSMEIGFASFAKIFSLV
uniref:Uncharacterized protein n=1 Tax=Rhizophora mucronata TaxID=61149 RepID=A0A2P2MLI2_RHIMU